MAVSTFDDKSKQPTASELEAALGEAATWLEDVEQHLADQYGEVTREFKFYSKKAGWTMALKHKKRRVFHLIPQSGLFTVVFALGKRAVSAAQESALPEESKAAIKAPASTSRGDLFASTSRPSRTSRL
jgi:hypothetical protein